MNRNLPSGRSALGVPPLFVVPPSGGEGGPSHFRASHPNRLKPGLRTGVALIITLIMLSVITIITVAILAIVTRDRTAVTAFHNLTDARLGAEAGLNRGLAEVVAQILSTTNPMGFELTVSRSMSNLLDRLQADPRVPVFLPTNQLFPDERLEGRFFLDLNRNGSFEQTYPFGPVGDPQWIGLLIKPDQPHGPNNRFLSRFAFLVVPAGKTLDINFVHNMHSSQQQGLYGFFRDQGFGPWEINLAGFLADLTPGLWSYQYDPLPLPRTSGTAFQDAKDILLYRFATNNIFTRPRVGDLYGIPGVMAFTNDLITGSARAPGAMGAGYPTTDPDTAWISNLRWPGADSARHFFTHQDFFDRSKIPSPAPPNPPALTFVDRLVQAGASTNAFDRYTFYRMLAQLGTDSAASLPQTAVCRPCLLAQLGPNPAAYLEDKIHLNYVNLPVEPATLAKINNSAPWNTPTTAIASTNLSATNFVSWDLAAAPELAVQFFTNVAERLLLQQFDQFNPAWNPANPALSFTNVSSVTHIPVAPTNEYSPSLHRLLQVAANLYDATRTNEFPSVFRPLITPERVGNVTNYFITGYTNDNRRSTLPGWLATHRAYGVPLVIGARKGFPNFNEYTMRTDVQVSRKLEAVRLTTNSMPHQTNQMYLVGISNMFAVEAWNSYSAPYPRPLTLEVSDVATVRITNQAGLNVSIPLTYAGSFANLPANFWQGKKFVLPLHTNEVLVPPSRYLFRSQGFETVGTNFFFTETQDQIGFPLPDWQFSLSNQFLYVLTDGDNLVDFVLSHDFSAYMNLDEEMMGPASVLSQSGAQEDGLVAQLWNTNRTGGTANVTVPTDGIMKQLDVSLGNQTAQVSDTVWRGYDEGWARGLDKNDAITTFRHFFGLGQVGGGATNAIGLTALRLQAPFCPTRKLLKTSTWQANDPLVHYHIGDMMIIDPSNPDKTNSITEAVVPPRSPIPTNMTLATLNAINGAYSPWGGNPKVNLDPLNPTEPNAINPGIKDPGARSSDDWEFPHGKFPGAGWLGRVHRGSPWQTVYFKPDAADEIAWRQISTDYFWYPTNGNQTFRFVRSHPTNDWVLADLFTTATDANSARGLLSINQTNLAAWSAVLSGVVVLKNQFSDQDVLSMTTNVPPPDPFLIEPLANDTNMPPAILTLVSNINAYRMTLPNQTFTSVGQLLQVRELTVQSPWLNWSSPIQQQFALTDAAYERLPQQILSLVKVGEPRFVIYAYGQALKPIGDSIDRAGLCHNYQVTAEVAVRAVVSVDKVLYDQGRMTNIVTSVKTFNILPPD